jgi:PAS domain S-box-containing protein
VPIDDAPQDIGDDQRIAMLVEAVADYAIYMLDVDGHVKTWNAGAARFKGYTREEILGQPFSRFYTPEDRAAGIPAQALDTAARTGRFEQEGWRVRKDGTLVWAHIVIDPIRDASDNLVGFAKITRDITERKEAQEALEKAQQALYEAQKMEALGSLSAGVAHDFNNILTVVLGNLDLLRRAPEERRRRLIDNATFAAEQGRKLTSQLLAFGRRQHLQPEFTDVNKLVLGMGDMLKQSLRGDIRFELDLCEEACIVEVDQSQFQIAMINLAANARDAMPNGGAFQIKTKLERSGGDTGGNVVITVSDSGHGMPPDVFARIFEPFFTTKEVGRGTGLGLPQVFGFTQQSGGVLDATSREGVGTSFRIVLPGRGLAEPVLPSKPEVAAEPELPPLRILLVEDNAHVADVAASLLRERGHSLIGAATAREALDVLSSGQPIDLVLSDLVMPGEMTGLDLAKEVREKWPALPVLLVTGYSDQAAKAVEDGFPLLSKPYQPELLVRAMAAAVARSPAHQSASTGKVTRLRNPGQRLRPA